MMSEFSTVAEDRVSPPVSAPSTPSVRSGVWQRPMLLGLSLPWLIGVVLILGLAGGYLFGPDRAPSVNQLAFREDHDEPPATERLGTPSLLPPPSEAGEGPFKEEVAAMIGGVRSYAETNRTAIGRLSDTVKSQSAAMTLQQQQLAEAQAQYSVLSARLASLEARQAAQAPTPRRVTKPVDRAPSLLSGMRLEAVQNGMAWVYWQDRTWAVKAGDDVGLVTVTRIDARAREVQTSAGTLK